MLAFLPYAQRLYEDGHAVVLKCCGAADARAGAAPAPEPEARPDRCALALPPAPHALSRPLPRAQPELEAALSAAAAAVASRWVAGEGGSLALLERDASLRPLPHIVFSPAFQSDGTLGLEALPAPRGGSGGGASRRVASRFSSEDEDEESDGSDDVSSSSSSSRRR